MAYGTIKVDTVTFTDGGVDKSVSISGLVQNPTFSGNITVTGTVSGNAIQGQTVSGVTVTGTTALFSTGTFISLTGTTSQGTTATYTSGSFTFLTGVTTSGTTANFVSGVFSTQISGATVTGNAGAFTTLTGGVTTITSGVFAAGSATNPSISFSSDTNTGIYSPGADQVAISTSGSGRLFVDASGNISAGNSTAFGPLDIKTSAGKRIVYTSLADYASNGIIGLTDGGNETDLGIGGNNLRFFTAAIERLRITSAGLVGIGTSSPSGLLHVAGQIYSSGTGYFGTNSPTLRLINSTATTGRTFGINSTDSGGFQVFDASAGDATRLWLDSSGRVGINTTSPRQALTFGGLTSSSTSTPDCIDLGATYTSTSASTNLKFKLYVDSSGNTYGFTVNGSNHLEYYAGTVGSPGNHVFLTGGTERLRITSAGLVGIGTSAPSNTLHVNSGAVGTSTLFESTGAGSYLGIKNSSGQWTLGATTTSFILENSGGTALTIDSSRRVGIGTTSPGVLLDVAGGNSIRVQASSSSISLPTGLSLTTGFGVGYLNNTDASGNAVDFGGASANFYWSADTHRFSNRPGTTEFARIDSSGRLLVGTSSGSYKFQINALGSSGFAFDDTNGVISNTFGTGGALELRAQVASSSGGGEIYLGGSTRGDSNINSIVLSTADTERMRIGANGYIHASNTGSYYSTGTSHELSGNSATESSLFVGSFNTSKSHGNTSACLVVGDYDSDYTNSNLFGGWNVTNNSWRIFIRGNGNVENVNNSYGALSDAKLKENIVNAGSQWDDIKALQVRKYNFKEGQTHIQIGLIAQEVELVSPGLVSESPDRDEDGNALGTVTKSVNYSVLYMKAVKALQEAMERIETLEAKVAALEA